MAQGTPEDELRRRLRDADESVRLNAALDLAGRGSPAGAKVLVDALDHRWGVVRRSFAAPALVSLGASVVEPLEHAAGGAGTRAVGAALALAEIDPERLPTALGALGDALAGDDREAVEDAVEYLWRRPDAATALAAISLLELAGAPGELPDDAPWPTEPRVTAALLLARTADVRGHGAFVGLLGRVSPALRWVGALALGQTGRTSAQAVDELSRRVLDTGERQEVRVAASYALARLAAPARRTMPVLAKLARDDAPVLRSIAARILGELGSPEPRHRVAETVYECHFSAHPLARLPRPDDALPPLLAALGDPDANVRRNAILALSWLGEAAAGACAPLGEELGKPYFGPLAAEALARIGEPAREVLAAAGGDHGRYGRELLDTGEARSFAPPVDDFYLRVPVTWDAAKLASFETLFDQAVERGGELEYDLPYPKHEFLSYLCDVRRLLLHGSDRGDLEVLRPLRSSTDSAAHGNVSGVYAEPDAIRPIYFAVVDRRHSFGLMNACFAFAPDGTEDTQLDRPELPRYYRLSIGVIGLAREPWRPGWVYALPRDTFEFWEEWTSRVPVRPVLRLAVEPDDLPLKAHLWGSDLRKPGSIWVDPRQPFPYLEDVWALPLRTLPGT